MTQWILLIVVLIAVGLGHGIWRQIVGRLIWKLAPPFAVGDVVRVGEHCGAVERIGWLHVHLRDEEGQVHVLPNSYVMARAVIRVGALHGSHAARLQLRVPTGMDPAAARRGVVDAVRISPYLAPDQPIHVVLEPGGGGGMVVQVRASVLDPQLAEAFTNSVIEGFDEILRRRARDDT